MTEVESGIEISDSASEHDLSGVEQLEATTRGSHTDCSEGKPRGRSLVMRWIVQVPTDELYKQMLAYLKGRGVSVHVKSPRGRFVGTGNLEAELQQSLRREFSAAVERDARIDFD